MITGPWYNRLKFLAQILLPALGTLYVALAAIWDFPKPQEVVGSIVAIDAFLGIILGLSQAKYLDTEVAVGEVVIKDGKAAVSIHDDPDVLEDLSEVRLHVHNPKRRSKKGQGKKPLASASRHRTGTRPSSWVSQNRPT